MPMDKRIHIMSAGQSIHKTFPIATKQLSYATKVYVIVEEKVFEKSDKIYHQETRDAIIESMNTLKKIADPFVEEGVEIVRISTDTLDPIRDAVISIYEKDKDAKYYLNMSGGTKGLSIGLFMMALWIEATPYHVDDEGLRVIPIPKVHMADFRKNPNRITILDILSKKPGEYIGKKDLEHRLADKYIPVKSPTKAKRILKPTVFNSLVKSLVDLKLIEKRFKEGNEKEIEYCITTDGEFTLKFMQI